MGNEDITIIVVSVICVVIVIVGIIAVSVYFCCGKSKHRRKPKRYQLPPSEPNNVQPPSATQDDTLPKSLPKVGSSGLWMTKPVMLAQGPNDAYHQLKPNGVRAEPVMMREILSTPNVNQPTSGYIYQGNLRMYHSQQIPNLVSAYGEHPRAYYNEAFIYPSYVDAGLSHRSSMRFLEASGYYAHREMHSRDSSLHPGKRDSRVVRNHSEIREGSSKPARFHQKSPQHEDRSRAAESEANSQSSSKNKSVSSSTASGVESVIERPVAKEAATTATTAVAHVTDRANESSSRHTNGERPSHSGEYVRTQADGKTNAEIATPSTSRQSEHENITLDSIHLAREQRDIPSDQQSYVDSVSDVTDMESKGQKITTQAFEFLDTYISDADEEVERPKYLSKRS